MKIKTRSTLAIMAAFLIGFASAFPIADTPIMNNKKEEEWSIEDSKAYAYDQLLDWQHEQYTCLVKLWGKESAWRSDAYNKKKVMGKNAGGIPQLLGLDPKLPATQQIDRGLTYIYHRYDTPCNAWKHFSKKGWY